MTPQEQQKRYDIIEKARMNLNASLPQLNKMNIIMERNGIPDDVYPLVGDASCIMMLYGGVETGIEKDGYSHQ